MFFKLPTYILRITSTCAFVLFVLGVGCTPFLQKDGRVPLLADKKTDPGILLIGTSGLNCLAGAPKHVRRYFQGTADEAEVDQFWRCSAEALRKFRDYFEGADDTGAHADHELREFLERYFLGGTKISDKMLREMMRFKTLFFGGSISTLSTGEISAMIRTTESLRELCQRMRPHMRVIAGTFNDAARFDIPWEQMERVRSDLLWGAARLASLVSKSKVSYSIEDLTTFLSEIRLLEKQKTESSAEPWFTTSELDLALRLIRMMRQVLVAQTSPVIRFDEWDKTLNLGARIMIEWMRYRFSMYGREWPEVSAFTKYAQFGLEIFDILESASLSHPGNVIAFESLKDLLEVMGDLSMVPFGIRTRTAIGLLRPLAQRYMRDSSTLEVDPESTRGFTTAAIQRGRAHLVMWIRNQLALYKDFNLPAIDLGPGYTPELTKDFIEMRDRVPRLLLDRKNRLLFSRIEENKSWDLFSLSQLNWRTVIVRLVIQSYSRDPVRCEGIKGLNFAEFENFYRDIRFFGRDIAILDPRDASIVQTVFDQGNHFSMASVPDNFLSLAEGVDLITYAQSVSGMNGIYWNDMVTLAKDIETKNRRCSEFTVESPEDDPKARAEECERWSRMRQPVGVNLVGSTDTFNQPVLQTTAFRRLFLTYFSRFFATMPKLVNYFTSLKWPEREDVLALWEVSGRCAGRTDELPFETADTDKISMLFHYVETLFLRYDKKRQNYLMQEELDAMYPQLRGIIEREAADQINSPPPESWFGRQIEVSREEKIRFIYEYLLRNGQSPQWQKLAFAVWLLTPGGSIRRNWDHFVGTGRVTRTELYKAIASLRANRRPRMIIIGDQSVPVTRYCGPRSIWPTANFPVDMEPEDNLTAP